MGILPLIMSGLIKRNTVVVNSQRRKEGRIGKGDGGKNGRESG